MAHEAAGAYYSREINLGLGYRERYHLLKRAFPQAPPYEAFVKNTLPYQRISNEGELAFVHALALKREWSQRFWKDKSERSGVTDADRKDFQVVLIPPSRKRNGDRDFSKRFAGSLKYKPLGPHPVASLVKGPGYSGDPYEGPYNVKNFKKAKTVYIVASPLSKGDYADIEFVAQQYKMYGAKEVVLIAPFMSDQREDKNIKKIKKGKPIKYNGRLIKMMTWMQSLSPFVDKIINFESHSSAAQAIAALYGIPMATLSYEEELLGQVKDRLRDTNRHKFRPEKWKVVRPDEGRNLVATRIEERFGIEGVHLKQVRNSDTLKKEASALSDESKQKLKGTEVILYDDEAGTFGTMRNVIDQLVSAQVKGINIFLGHARLQRRWTSNLMKGIVEKCRKKGIYVKIYVTDSRIPVGSLSRFMEAHKDEGLIKTVPIAKKVRTVIEANVAGVDFAAENDFNGVNFERAYLQFTEEELNRKGAE